MSVAAAGLHRLELNLPEQGRQGEPSTIRVSYEFRGEIQTQGYRHVHSMRRLCVIDPPLHVKSLETKSLSVVKEAIFSQKHNRKITEHWWLLYEMLGRKYPDLAAAIEPYSPSRV
jgi:hypothetical protein